MKAQALVGVVFVLAEGLLLYLLRKLLVELIVLAIGFLGIIVGFALVVGGLGMIFWSRPRWGR